MENIYSKQVDLINRYTELSDFECPRTEIAVDLRQEINRNYHIINHILRAQFNYVGRFTFAGVFGVLGGIVYCCRANPFSKGRLIRESVIFFTYLVTSVSVGYLFGKRFFSKRKDAKSNYNRLQEFRKKYDAIINEAETKIELKLKNKSI